MPAESTPPKLLEILFGDSAPTAQRLASGRLLLWCEAFEAWLDWRQQSYGVHVYYKSLLSWRRLLQERRKTPWELTQGDIEAHAARMLDRETAASKINDDLGMIANFYRWCNEHQVDPICPPDFNPAAAAPRLKVRLYARTVLLSRDEMQSLLGFMSRDESPLGRRDYAFILARLRLGVPLQSLLALQWGQIVHNSDGVRISSSVTMTQSKGISSEALRPLPADVWEAIRTALAAAGRLACMQPESYAFAPLVEPLKEGEHDRTEDWAEGRCISSQTAKVSLKRYGHRLGIPDEKLTLLALRHTATRLRLEEGYTLEEMKAFLKSTERPALTTYRLRRLPPFPLDVPGESPSGEGSQPELPRHKGKRFQPEDRRTHGLYARSQPPEAVAAILAEDIQGIDEELVGLRTLARSLPSARLPVRPNWPQPTPRPPPAWPS